jgi:hypothetical protein
MQDQPTQRDAAREFDVAERLVLDMLLDPDFPGPWTIQELGRAMGNEVEAADAVMGLDRAGLVHRIDQYVFASWPAARAMKLGEAL